MRALTIPLAISAALATAACGASADEPANDSSSDARAATTRQSESPIQFGKGHRFPSGVSIVISCPKPFQPSASAFPRSERAVAFEIAINNDGHEPYRPSELSVNVLANGKPVREVVDATRGFNGIVDADKDLAPTRNVRLDLAFEVPAEQADIRMTVHPDAERSTSATYQGCS